MLLRHFIKSNLQMFFCVSVRECVCESFPHSVRMLLVTHSSLRAQRRPVGEPYLQSVCVSSWYSLSATLRGIPSQARMRMTITAFWQQWPARCRTRQSNFSCSLPRRMICRMNTCYMREQTIGKLFFMGCSVFHAGHSPTWRLGNPVSFDPLCQCTLQPPHGLRYLSHHI